MVVNQAQLLDSTERSSRTATIRTSMARPNPGPAVDDEDPTRVRIGAPPSPPTKTLVSPSIAEATIGEELVYRIAVPGEPRNSPMYDVQVTDVLNANLEYVSATVSGVGGVTNTSTSIAIEHRDRRDCSGPAGVHRRARARTQRAQRPAGCRRRQHGLFHVLGNRRWRRGAGADDQSGVLQHRRADHDDRQGGEPSDRGCQRHHPLHRHAHGSQRQRRLGRVRCITDRYAGRGPAIRRQPDVTGTGNTIGAPVVTGDGSGGSPQTLVWSLGDGNADIDIAEGESIKISYDVRVLSNVLADQD